MTDLDRNAEFPMDWNEWRSQWNRWEAEQEHDGRFQRTAYQFPDKNFLADEVLGVWHVGHRNVELSEVTFMNSRAVGITYGTAAGTETPGLAHSFAELEQILTDTAGASFK